MKKNSRLVRLALWGAGLRAGLAALAAGFMFSMVAPSAMAQPAAAPENRRLTQPRGSDGGTCGRGSAVKRRSWKLRRKKKSAAAKSYDTGDTVLDDGLDHPRPSDDRAGPRALLRRPGAHQEHAVDADAGHDRDRDRHDRVGAVGILAFLHRRAEGSNKFIGGTSKMFLNGAVDHPTDIFAGVETFSVGVYIPELVFVCFQMTFACITAALVLGGVAERLKFAGVVIFAVLWPLLSYYPMAHMVWWWSGATSAVGQDAASLAGGAGQIWAWGALDFAGGTVVHINAGIAALMGALILGKRTGYKQSPMPPHSLVLTYVGAGLLWVGWFGFNAGSNLEANGYAAVAMVNTLLATAAAGLSWVIVEWVLRRRPSMLGAGVRHRRGSCRRHASRGLRWTNGRDRTRPHRLAGLRHLLLDRQERAQIRRQPGRLRHPRRRRHRRRHRHRHPGRSGPRRRGHHRLVRPARRKPQPAACWRTTWPARSHSRPWVSA